MAKPCQGLSRARSRPPIASCARTHGPFAARNNQDRSTPEPGASMLGGCPYRFRSLGSSCSELTQSAVSLRPAVPVELPHVPNLSDLVEIELRRDKLVLIATRLRDDLSARIAKIALPVKLSDVPRLLETDAID